jgi:uncharacterized protein (TIGR03437 family)
MDCRFEGKRRQAMPFVFAGFVIAFFAVLCQANTQPPQVNAVVDAASFGPALAPGELVSIFGTNMADSPTEVVGLPLPSEILDVEVTLNDQPLSLLYISGSQINAQLPFDAPATGQLRISTPQGVSEIPVQISAAAPAIFSVALDSGIAPAALHADGSLVSAAAPAQPGEFIALFVTGLGQVSGSILDGQPAPADPPISTSAAAQILIDDAVVAPTFSGLAPGFAGLYQLNFQVPQTTTGSHPLRVQIGNNSSGALPLSITASTDAAPIGDSVASVTSIKPDSGNR